MSRVKAFLLGALVASLVSVGAWMNADTKAVCHAPTEDSIMADCYYENGGWYRD